MINIFVNDLISDIQCVKSNKTAKICKNIFAYKTRKYKCYIDSLEKTVLLLKRNLKYFQRNNMLSLEYLDSFYFKVKSELLAFSYSVLSDTKKTIFKFLPRTFWGSYSAVKKVIKLLDKKYLVVINE